MMGGRTRSTCSCAAPHCSLQHWNATDALPVQVDCSCVSWFIRAVDSDCNRSMVALVAPFAAKTASVSTVNTDIGNPLGGVTTLDRRVLGPRGYSSDCVWIIRYSKCADRVLRSTTRP